MTIAGPVEAPPVYGLVLAGGRSRRMGRDKGTIAYRGEPHARFTASLLARFCGRVFISCRADQAGDSVFGHWPMVVDAYPGWGPLGGILSAFRAHPQVAFLVAACDLPFLDGEALERLLRGRDAGRAATAFWNPERGLPEPLCALYEPRFAAVAQSRAEGGCLCPTDLLLGLDVRPLPLPRGGCLVNANTPEDFRKAAAAWAERTGAHA